MTRFSRLEKAAEQTEEGEQDKKNLLYFDLDLTSKRVYAKPELFFGGKKKINLATSGGPWREFYFLLR